MEDNDKRRAGLRRHAETKSEIYSKNEAESAPKGRILSLVVFFLDGTCPSKKRYFTLFCRQGNKTLLSIFRAFYLCLNLIRMLFASKAVSTILFPWITQRSKPRFLHSRYSERRSWLRPSARYRICAAV